MGFFGKLWNGIKNVAGKVWNGSKTVGKGLSNGFEWVKDKVGKIGNIPFVKTLWDMSKKIPMVGTVTSGLETAYNTANKINDVYKDLTKNGSSSKPLGDLKATLPTGLQSAIDKRIALGARTSESDLRRAYAGKGSLAGIRLLSKVKENREKRLDPASFIRGVGTPKNMKTMPMPQKTEISGLPPPLEPSAL